MKIIAKTTLALVLLAIAGSPAFADGGGGDYRNSRLRPYLDLIEAEKYQQAIDELTRALEKKPEDADLLNLVAFSNRKLERFDSALEYYLKALGIEPEHRGANEYLGELYLQLGQLDKAQERLAVLDDACFFGCDEYDELEQAIEEYRRQNPS
jgi:tetratricopeptide (TPR) repeat protein